MDLPFACLYLIEYNMPDVSGKRNFIAIVLVNDSSPAFFIVVCYSEIIECLPSSLLCIWAVMTWFSSWCILCDSLYLNVFTFPLYTVHVKCHLYTYKTSKVIKLNILYAYLSFCWTHQKSIGLFKAEDTYWLIMNHNCPIGMFAIKYINF